jgi:hypothetical protein
MDEEQNEDKARSLIKLLRDSGISIALNKVTDHSPKLSDQGLVIYKALVDQITFIKKQQWTITNYAALLYGAIFVFAKEPSEHPVETGILARLWPCKCGFMVRFY